MLAPSAFPHIAHHCLLCLPTPKSPVPSKVAAITSKPTGLAPVTPSSRDPQVMDHPNIIKLYETFEDRLAAPVMERVSAARLCQSRRRTEIEHW